MKNKKNKRTDKEEVCETFEVEKEGKEKEIKTCGLDTVEHANKKELDNQNKILRNFLIIMGFVILFFIGLYFSSSLMTKFEVNGVDYKITKENDLLLYNTQLPGKVNDQKVIYNFYLRNDPRKLEEIDFSGDLVFAPTLVINMSEEPLNCDGDDIIAIANLVKLYEFIGTTVIKDPNATCDEMGRYAIINIKEGNETKIKRTGQACYELTFNNCEILGVTERLMTEVFSEVNKQIN